jgi:hypothetical protein
MTKLTEGKPVTRETAQLERDHPLITLYVAMDRPGKVEA